MKFLKTLLSQVFKNKKLTYEDPNLKAGATFMAQQCIEGLKQGVEPIQYKINHIKREQDIINISAFFLGKETSKKNVSLSELNEILS